MKVLDYGAERKWQGLSALSVPLLPKPLFRRDGIWVPGGAKRLVEAVPLAAQHS